MLLQRIQRVLEIMGVVFLLGILIIRFARNVEIVGRSLVIFLQNFVEKDVPNLGSDFTRLGLEQQILEVVIKVLDNAIEVHGLAEDGGAITGEEAILGEKRCGVGGIAEGYGEGGSRLNVVVGSDSTVPPHVEGDFAVRFRAVIELSVSVSTM